MGTGGEDGVQLSGTPGKWWGRDADLLFWPRTGGAQRRTHNVSPTAAAPAPCPPCPSPRTLPCCACYLPRLPLPACYLPRMALPPTHSRRACPLARSPFPATLHPPRYSNARRRRGTTSCCPHTIHTRALCAQSACAWRLPQAMTTPPQATFST